MSDKAKDKSKIPIIGKWWTSGCKIVRHATKSWHCDDDDSSSSSSSNNNNN
jgi:hypothetical protein